MEYFMGVITYTYFEITQVKICVEKINLSYQL